MKLAYALTALLALSSPSLADHPVPPVPEGGINYTIQGECQDNETGEKGYCYAGYTKDGTFVLSFWQDGVLKMIRRVVGDSYETIWVAHGFGEV